MTKEEVLQELSSKLASGEISRDELLERLPKSTSRHFSVNKLLYLIGAAIVVVGIVVFISQIWPDIGPVGRIVVTLGFGLLLAVVGSILLKQRPGDHIGAVFHLLGGILIPGGALVALYELGVQPLTAGLSALAIGIVFVFYLLLTLTQKHPLLTFFALANGTAFIYLLIEAIVSGHYYSHGSLYAYLTMVVGVCYILLARAFRTGWNRRLVGLLHFLGSFGFFAAAFSRTFDTTPWQLGYFLLVAIGLYLAVYLKSRSFLVVSTIFLIAHLAHLTGEYFADSLGWPISLVVLGLIFIALGYFSLTLNRKYLKTTA